MKNILSSLKDHRYLPESPRELSEEERVFLSRAAYIFATIHHETGGTFQPIREGKASAVKNPRIWALQRRYWESGFYGRGYVQLTWEPNYRNAGVSLAGRMFVLPDGETITIDRDTFYHHPDYMLLHYPAMEIALVGMEKGLFAKDANGNPHTLKRYINASVCDYINARRIINGVDRTERIATIAIQCQRALLKASMA